MKKFLFLVLISFACAISVYAYDGNIISNPGSSSVSAGTFLGDDTLLGFGNVAATPDVRLGWNTAQTVDALFFGLADAQNTLIIAENGDRAFDFAHPAQTNPTLFIHSANQNTTEWGSIASTGTDFLFTVGGDGIDSGQNIVFQMNTYNGNGPEFQIKDGLGTKILSLSDDGLIFSLPGNFNTPPQFNLGNVSLTGSVGSTFKINNNGYFAFTAARTLVGSEYSIMQTSNALSLNAPSASMINLDIGGAVITTVSSTGLTSRIIPRVVIMADATSTTPTGDTADINTQANTQIIGTLTVNAPSGTPLNGQMLELVIKSTNVQTFAWNAIYVGGTTTALPTATTGGTKTDRFFFQYDTVSSKWNIINAEYGY